MTRSFRDEQAFELSGASHGPESGSGFRRIPEGFSRWLRIGVSAPGNRVIAGDSKPINSRISSRSMSIVRKPLLESIYPVMNGFLKDQKRL